MGFVRDPALLGYPFCVSDPRLNKREVCQLCKEIFRRGFLSRAFFFVASVSAATLKAARFLLRGKNPWWGRWSLSHAEARGKRLDEQLGIWLAPWYAHPETTRP